MFHQYIRSLFGRFGYDIRYAPRLANEIAGRYPHVDIQRLLGTQRPMIFDVGANVGQSVMAFKRRWPRSTVHAFEPSPVTCGKLKCDTQQLSGVFVNECAVGERSKVATFHENQYSVLSSLLVPDHECDCMKIRESLEVPVTTIDEYCDVRGIEQIDLLKTDTQGYEVEVLRGARTMFCSNRIHLVLAEIIFSNMYCAQGRFDVVLGTLADAGFKTVAFYDFRYRNNCVEWCDALFVNPCYSSAKVKQCECR